LGIVSPLTGLAVTGATFRLQERDDAESVFSERLDARDVFTDQRARR
jgi:hypothetical protein